MNFRIDALQYANWSEKIFRQLREGRLDGIHVTITYHENFRETVLVMESWNRWFERYPDLVFQGFDAGDLEKAQQINRTAIFFGSQNPSCMEDDIGLGRFSIAWVCASCSLVTITSHCWRPVAMSRKILD